VTTKDELLALAERCEREEPSDGLSIDIFHAIAGPSRREEKARAILRRDMAADYSEIARAEAKTGPLALCAAALRARSHDL
jgi:hypothetical protein